MNRNHKKYKDTAKSTRADFVGMSTWLGNKKPVTEYGLRVIDGCLFYLRGLLASFSSANNLLTATSTKSLREKYLFEEVLITLSIWSRIVWSLKFCECRRYSDLDMVISSQELIVYSVRSILRPLYLTSRLFSQAVANYRVILFVVPIRRQHGIYVIVLLYNVGNLRNKYLRHLDLLLLVPFYISLVRVKKVNKVIVDLINDCGIAKTKFITSIAFANFGYFCNCIVRQFCNLVRCTEGWIDFLIKPVFNFDSDFLFYRCLFHCRVPFCLFVTYKIRKSYAKVKYLASNNQVVASIELFMCCVWVPE